METPWRLGKPWPTILFYPLTCGPPAPARLDGRGGGVPNRPTQRAPIPTPFRFPLPPSSAFLTRRKPPPTIHRRTSRTDRRRCIAASPPFHRRKHSLLRLHEFSESTGIQHLSFSSEQQHLLSLPFRRILGNSWWKLPHAACYWQWRKPNLVLTAAEVFSAELS